MDKCHKIFQTYRRYIIQSESQSWLSSSYSFPKASLKCICQGSFLWYSNMVALSWAHKTLYIFAVTLLVQKQQLDHGLLHCQIVLKHSICAVIFCHQPLHPQPSLVQTPITPTLSPLHTPTFVPFFPWGFCQDWSRSIQCPSILLLSHLVKITHP
jgi:hypothetical protein